MVQKLRHLHPSQLLKSKKIVGQEIFYFFEDFFSFNEIFQLLLFKNLFITTINFRFFFFKKKIPKLTCFWRLYLDLNTMYFIMYVIKKNTVKKRKKKHFKNTNSLTWLYDKINGPT